MKFIFVAILYACLWIAGLVAWLTGIVVDVKDDALAWAVADVLLPPLGIIRGLIAWFS